MLPAFHDPPSASVRFSCVATFSLFPLLKRDGQALPYALFQIWAFALPLSSSLLLAPGQRSPLASLPPAVRFAIGSSVCGMLLLHAAEAFVPPPQRLPDIHSVHQLESAHPGSDCC